MRYRPASGAIVGNDALDGRLACDATADLDELILRASQIVVVIRIYFWVGGCIMEENVWNIMLK